MVNKGAVKLCGQPSTQKHHVRPMSMRSRPNCNTSTRASTTSSCSSSSASSYSCPSCLKSAEPLKLKKLPSPRKTKCGSNGEGAKFYRRYKHTAVPCSNKEEYCPSLANYAFLALIYFIWTMTVLLFQ